MTLSVKIKIKISVHLCTYNMRRNLEVNQSCIVFGLYRTLHEIESAIESAIKPTLNKQKHFDIPTLYRNCIT